MAAVSLFWTPTWLPWRRRHVLLIFHFQLFEWFRAKSQKSSFEIVTLATFPTPLFYQQWHYWRWKALYNYDFFVSPRSVTLSKQNGSLRKSSNQWGLNAPKRLSKAYYIVQLPFAIFRFLATNNLDEKMLLLPFEAYTTCSFVETNLDTHHGKHCSRHGLQNLWPHLVRTGSRNATWQIKHVKSSSSGFTNSSS